MVDEGSCGGGGSEVQQRMVGEEQCFLEVHPD